MKQKLVKALKKIGILQLESIVHKPASTSLAAQKEQVIAEKKNCFVGPNTYYTNKKKSVLTTGGGLPVQSGNPLKHAGLCLRDELNKPCSQPEYVNHFKPTLYHHHGNLKGDKESSCPEERQPAGWHLPQHADAILLTAASLGPESSDCSSFRSLSFAHSQARAGTCPQKQR